MKNKFFYSQLAVSIFLLFLLFLQMFFPSLLNLTASWNDQYEEFKTFSIIGLSLSILLTFIFYFGKGIPLESRQFTLFVVANLFLIFENIFSLVKD